MRLKVVSQLSLGDEHDLQELLYLGVASLCVGQDLAYKVYGQLHFEGMSLLLFSTTKASLTTKVMAMI